MIVAHRLDVFFGFFFIGEGDCIANGALFCLSIVFERAISNGVNDIPIWFNTKQATRQATINDSESSWKELKLHSDTRHFRDKERRSGNHRS